MQIWKKVLIVVAILVILIIVQTRNSEISGPFKGILGNILNPVIYVSDAFFSTIEDVFSKYIFLIDVEAENGLYKDEISKLKLKNIILQEKLNAANRLIKLQDYNEAYEFTTVAGNVIGATDGYVKQITIDIGSTDGVEKDDPVISYNGLVGKVTRAFLNTSEVEVILSLSSNVSVTNERTRAVAILRGDGKGQLFLDYYDRLDDVQVGDNFITSGLGMLFPKGIPVGKVSSVIKAKNGLFQKVHLEQVEDFYKLENVLIVKNFKK